MKKNYTDITIILDRSGSMQTIASDVEGGMQKFIEDQKKIGGKCTLTLVKFDNEYKKVFECKDIQEVEAIKLEPRGMTALLDAIGRTISDTGLTYAAMQESERPENVIFVVITDGMENASTEYDRERVFNMIKHQTEVYNWHFVFLAANQDAIAEGATMGFSSANSMTYSANSIGVKSAYCSVSHNIGALRSGQTTDLSFTAEDRKAQENI